MGCVSWIIAVILGVFTLTSIIRWFDEATEAVQNGWWNKVSLLLLFPFSCWFYPNKVAAGRPTPVPLHEPVRGFGSIGKSKPQPTESSPTTTSQAPPPATSTDDQPPSGTPPEFLIKPKPTKRPSIPVDPDKLAKLKAKMREQGMLGDE
jgi:hypothetical protein